MSLARELLVSLVDVAEHDTDVQRRLRALALMLGIASATADTTCEPAHMTISAYADRVSLSKRTIHSLVKAGLPCVGVGRLRRVDVARADAWLRDRRDRTDDALESGARQRARRAALRAMPGGKT